MSVLEAQRPCEHSVNEKYHKETAEETQVREWESLFNAFFPAPYTVESNAVRKHMNYRHCEEQSSREAVKEGESILVLPAGWPGFWNDTKHADYPKENDHCNLKVPHKVQLLVVNC